LADAPFQQPYHVRYWYAFLGRDGGNVRRQQFDVGVSQNCTPARFSILRASILSNMPCFISFPFGVMHPPTRSGVGCIRFGAGIMATP
jgi:hypothetical protein